MASPKQKNILLVEDDVIISENQLEILKINGYNVITAYSGGHAVEIIENKLDIDLILMDIDLGNGIDGTVASKIILEKRDIPIIFLSSHTEPEIVKKTENITTYGYVIKNSGEFVLIASIKMAFKLFDAKKEIQDRELLLSKTERIAKVGGYRWNTNNNTVSVTNGFLDIHGLSKQELPVDELLQIAHPEDLPLIEKALLDARSGLKTYHIKHRILKADTKEIRTIISSGEIVKDFNGKEIGMYGSCIDITEEKKIEDLLFEKERKYKQLFNTIRDGIVILQVVYDSNSLPIDYIIVDGNPAYETILNVKRSERIGKRVSDIYPQAKYLDLFGKLEESSAPVQFETFDNDLQKRLFISAFSIGKGLLAVIFSNH